MNDLSICFVYQSGEIATKARHLLTSIRKFSKECKIFVGIPLPENIYDRIPQAEISSLRHEFNVQIIYFTNSISHSYKIGNKIQLFYEASKYCKGSLLFLDSDILQLAPFVPTEEMLKKDLSMKLADTGTFHYSTYLIKKYSLKPGNYLTTVTQQKLLFPYCNAGFIFCSASGLKKRFPEEWLKVARELFNDSQVTNKFPWLDQIAIPIVINRLKLNLHLLSEDYNYPFHLRRSLRSGIIFCHYHSLENLERVK